VAKPGLTRRAAGRILDGIVLLICLATVVQAVPFPSPIVDALSPQAAVIRQELSLNPSIASWAPLSIDEPSTLWANAVIGGTIALFFAARSILAAGGLRQTVRGISALGLGFSMIALAQAATAGRFIYWRFPTEYEGPLPFGPFVNRNHFATWIIMAAPVCFGYIIARANAPAPASGSLMSRRAKLTRMADGRMAWLAVAGAMMIVALLVSMSRSGILSLAVAVGISAIGLQRRATNRGWWVAGVLVLALGLALARAEIPALAERFVRSRTSVEDRLRIWSDTLPMVRDFWLTGTGAGTYRTAMLYYQRADRVDVQFNQAHNHYLQAAAEGGIVLEGLILAGLFALSATVRERLGSERTGAFWIRAGSACGLLAVALQSLWETGLVMPANAALAAVLAAIACHER
jgi:putative inorganic carbon (HCO3(-)) transporter